MHKGLFREGIRSARRPRRAAQGNRLPSARRRAHRHSLGPSGAHTRDLLNVLESVKQAGAGFRSLKDTWADTTTPHGQLMLTILGGLAEFERTLIRARTGEGRERAIRQKINTGVHGRSDGVRNAGAGTFVTLLVFGRSLFEYCRSFWKTR
jgi:hypothetical protein